MRPPDPAVENDRRERFATLADAAVEPVRRYLARRTDPTTAEDVLSETLLVCWRRVEEVPAEAPVAWAIGVARLCLANAHRAERRRDRLTRRVGLVDPPTQRVPGPGESDDGAEDAARDAERVVAALAGLGEKDAEVLRLWAWDELTQSGIAAVLGISISAAGVRLHRAKKRLRARLSEDGRP
ncbi:RNA polymerase sigma factor [Kineococcus gynurae]|uniref:RNA polymerase sigma factor n=1 Tax=Kineococcus gynurae TaxID=452979 RepID=A0ABV5LTP3_9ACTN